MGIFDFTLSYLAILVTHTVSFAFDAANIRIGVDLSNQPLILTIGYRAKGD
jgi:hypothetical protein